MKTHTVIAKTNKGHRVFLEGLNSVGWPAGARYHVDYCGGEIIITQQHSGKRKVVASKGGVIDLEGKKVTQWAKGHDSVTIAYSAAQIIITLPL